MASGVGDDGAVGTQQGQQPQQLHTPQPSPSASGAFRQADGRGVKSYPGTWQPITSNPTWLDLLSVCFYNNTKLTTIKYKQNNRLAATPTSSKSACLDPDVLSCFTDEWMRETWVRERERERKRERGERREKREERKRERAREFGHKNVFVLKFVAAAQNKRVATWSYHTQCFVFCFVCNQE